MQRAFHRSVLIATLRGAHFATTGRELGDSARGRPEIGTQKDRSCFRRSVNDIAIKRTHSGDRIGRRKRAPTKHRAGAMISTQLVANRG
jgi:hypothetical protein